MARETTYTLDFSEIGLSDVPRVGGKNASLGQLFKELRPLGVGVLDGFATTAEAYRLLLREGDLEGRLRSILAGLDVEDVQDLARRAHEARETILETRIPEEIETAVLAAHERLIRRLGRDVELAVRSSATAEDLRSM
jgi:pyruvate,water dikinase